MGHVLLVLLHVLVLVLSRLDVFLNQVSVFQQLTGALPEEGFQHNRYSDVHVLRVGVCNRLDIPNDLLWVNRVHVVTTEQLQQVTVVLVVGLFGIRRQSRFSHHVHFHFIHVGGHTIYNDYIVFIPIIRQTIIRKNVTLM